MSTVLRVWLIPSAGIKSSDELGRKLKPFLERHPEISIELRLIPWSRGWTEIMNAHRHGDMPDIFQAGSTWISTLAHLRLLSTVPTSLKNRPTVAPWVDSVAVYEGAQIAVPWLLECSVMAVRSDLLQEAGLDIRDLADWERFHEACLLLSRTLKQNSSGPAVPLIVHSRPEYNTLHWAVPWLWSGGWRPFDPHTSPFLYLSHPSATPGFSYMSRLFRTSPAIREVADAPTGRIYADFFDEGRYPIYFGPSDTVMRARAGAAGQSRKGIAGKAPVSIVPIPRGPNGSKTRAGGSWLCVSRHSNHRSAAWELVKYMSEDPFLSWRAAAGGEFPAYESAYWHASHDEERPLLRNILATAHTYPQHPLWRTMERTLMEGFSEIFWRFVQGYSHDAESRQIAARLDERLASLISLGWEIPA